MHLELELFCTVCVLGTPISGLDTDQRQSLESKFRMNVFTNRNPVRYMRMCASCLLAPTTLRTHSALTPRAGVAASRFAFEIPDNKEIQIVKGLRCIDAGKLASPGNSFLINIMEY